MEEVSTMLILFLLGKTLRWLYMWWLDGMCFSKGVLIDLFSFAYLIFLQFSGVGSTGIVALAHIIL